jgi:hypothetical protein
MYNTTRKICDWRARLMTTPTILWYRALPTQSQKAVEEDVLLTEHIELRETNWLKIPMTNRGRPLKATLCSDNVQDS